MPRLFLPNWMFCGYEYDVRNLLLLTTLPLNLLVSLRPLAVVNPQFSAFRIAISVR
jgi:hypothetical protein